MEYISLDHYGLGTKIIDMNKYDRFVEANKVKAKSTDSTSRLRIVVDATRSGSIVNGRSYKGSSLYDSYKSFMNPFAKPILKDHNSWNVDAIIGRASGVEFERLVDSEKFDNDFLYAKKGGIGSARLLVQSDIIDETSIVKFLDGRYATFSTGQRLSSMICSHCGKDYFTSYLDERHWPGQIKELTEDSPLVKSGKFKEGHKMEVYGIATVAQYDELSTVVTPAQPRALIERIINDFSASNSIDMQTDEKGKKYAIDLAKLLVSGHYSRPDHSLYTVHMTDSENVSHSLMFNDYQAEIEQKVTGRTTVQVTVPADSQNPTLTRSTDSEQTSSKKEAVEADSTVNKQMEVNKMDPKQIADQKAAFDAAIEAKAALQAKFDALTSEKAAVDTELKSVKAEVATTKTSLDSITKELKDSYVKTLTTMRVATCHASVDKLDEKGLVAYEAELASRTLDSLKNSISDETPAFKVLLSDLKDSINKGASEPRVASPLVGEDSGNKTSVVKETESALSDL